MSSYVGFQMQCLYVAWNITSKWKFQCISLRGTNLDNDTKIKQ